MLISRPLTKLLFALAVLALVAGCRGEPTSDEAASGDKATEATPTPTDNPTTGGADDETTAATPPATDTPAVPEPPAEVEEPPEPDSTPADWPEALAAVALADPSVAIVIEPEPTLAWFGRARARLRAASNRPTTPLDGLLERVPAPLLPLADPGQWAELGLDATRPVAVWIDVGPDDVMQIFTALQYDALTGGGGDPATRGAQIGAALENLTAHLRFALPVTHGGKAIELVSGLLTEAGFEVGTTDLVPVSDTGKLFRRGSSVVRIERDTDRGMILVDAVATQSTDTLAGAGKVLTAAASAQPGTPLIAPRTNAMIHLTASTDALAGLDAMQSTLGEGGRSLEPVIRRLLHHSAFDAVSLTLDTHHLTATGRFADPHPELVEAVAASPWLPLPEPGDAPPLATAELSSVFAAQTGPWADAGLALPEAMTPSPLELVDQLGPMALAVPLWVPLMPSLAWRSLDEGWRVLDPAQGYGLQLVVPADFAPTSPDTWRMAARLAAPDTVSAETLATSLSCVAQGKPGTGCEPALAVGQTAEIKTPIVDPVRLRVDASGESGVASVATTEALLEAQQAIAPVARTATEGRTPLMHARVDLEAVFALLTVPPGVAQAASVIDGLDLQTTLDAGSVEMVLETTGERPLAAAMLEGIGPMLVFGGR